MSLDDLFQKSKTGLSLEARLIGRLLAQPLIILGEDSPFPINMEIDIKIVLLIAKYKLKNVKLFF